MAFFKAVIVELLLIHLHRLPLKCFEEDSKSWDMRDAKIIALYKNEGDRNCCMNCLGICNLSTVGKSSTCVVLSRLHSITERMYLEAQCNSRPSWCTINMIFSLRQTQEKRRDQRCPLPIAPIDLNGSFNLISRKGFPFF